MLINRAMHLDFHTLPNIYDFGARYNADEFAATLKNAHVEYVNLVASCNLGFCYFPTNVGVRYPYMQGDRFGETLRVHKQGNKIVEIWEPFHTERSPWFPYFHKVSK